MEHQWERDLDPSPEWQNLMDLIEVVANKPSAAKFAAVGRAALLWGQAKHASARDVTSHSSSESAVYKENSRLNAVYNHTLQDHPGEPHDSVACLAVDDQEQDNEAEEDEQDDQ